MNVFKPSSAKKSAFLKYLPTIYQEENPEFLDRFLKIFEKLWSGIDDGVAIERGGGYHPIEDILDYIHCYFHPDKAPKDFLLWIASSWVYLPDDEKDICFFDLLSEAEQRSYIKKAIDLHRIRGTLPSLKIYLEEFYVKNAYKKYMFHFSQETPLYGESQQELDNDEALIEIVENFSPLRPMVIGISSTIGIDSNLIDPIDVAHHFTLFIHTGRIVPGIEIDHIKKVLQVVKPAHTLYHLRICLSKKLGQR